MAGNFELKSFKTGKSEHLDKGVEGSFKLSKNLNVRGETDSLSCNQALVAEGAGVIVDLVLFWVNSEDGNTYGFGDSGKIYKRTSAGVWSVVYTDAGGRIIGASEWYDATRTFVVWSTATAVHHKLIPGATDWSDVDATVATWPKTIDTADWHTMAQADGSLMICNGKKLAQLGFDWSFTTEILALRYGVTAKTVMEYGNSVLIGGGDGVKESYLLTWDHSAQNWTGKNRIPVKTINAIADAEITLMNCTDKSGGYKMFFSNMSDRMPVVTMDGQSYPGAVVEDNGLALFGVFGGSLPGVYSFGRKEKNGVFAYNLEYYIDADEIGALTFIGGVLFVSYKKDSTYWVKKVDVSNKAVAEYYSLDLKNIREVPWSTLEMVTDEIPADCSIAVYYAMKSLTIEECLVSENWTQAKLPEENTASDGRDPVFMIGSEGRIVNIKIVLTPSGNTTPIIHELKINFM